VPIEGVEGKVVTSRTGFVTVSVLLMSAVAHAQPAPPLSSACFTYETAKSDFVAQYDALRQRLKAPRSLFPKPLDLADLLNMTNHILTSAKVVEHAARACGGDLPRDTADFINDAVLKTGIIRDTLLRMLANTP
jgi:hypothetical protein